MLFVATVSVLVAAAGSIVFQQGKFGEPGTWCDPHDMDGMLLTIVPPFFVVVPIGRHRRDCTSHRTSVAIFFSFFFSFLFHFVRAQLTVVESCSPLEKKNSVHTTVFFSQYVNCHR